MSTENDFDFLAGAWRVSHRRLQRRLAGCDTWDSFSGSCRMWKLLGGFGNVDDNVLDLPGGSYRAAALRAFDPKTRLWSIWWLDGRTPGPIDPPMVGCFAHGDGVFEADELFEGRPIRVRFRWLDTGSEAPRWEQAFSADAGVNWETNWTMVFARAG